MSKFIFQSKGRLFGIFSYTSGYQKQAGWKVSLMRASMKMYKKKPEMLSLTEFKLLLINKLARPRSNESDFLKFVKISEARTTKELNKIAEKIYNA